MINLTITMLSALGFVGFILSLCGILYVNADRLEHWAINFFHRNR